MLFRILRVAGVRDIAQVDRTRSTTSDTDGQASNQAPLHCLHAFACSIPEPGTFIVEPQGGLPFAEVVPGLDPRQTQAPPAGHAIEVSSVTFQETV